MEHKHSIDQLNDKIKTIQDGLFEPEFVKQFEDFTFLLKKRIEAEHEYAVWKTLETEKGLPVKKIEEILGENEDQILGRDIVLKACKAPFDAILANAGLNADVVWNQIVTHNANGSAAGYDVRTETVLEDMFDAGIVDPVKVTRIALEKAASVAGTMLTTECVMVDIKEDASTTSQPQMPMM